MAELLDLLVPYCFSIHIASRSTLMPEKMSSWRLPIRPWWDHDFTPGITSLKVFDAGSFAAYRGERLLLLPGKWPKRESPYKSHPRGVTHLFPIPPTHFSP